MGKLFFFAGIALVLLALLLPPAATPLRPAFFCPGNKPLAITWMQEARGYHQGWLDYIRSGKATKREIAAAGDAAWQIEWINRYNVTIQVLREARCP